jgi:hypothetical protein
MTYIPPDEVASPQRHWHHIKVLDDKGEGESALALGLWDRKGVLAVRWNGEGDNPIGNPQSRGLPIWFILPDEYCEAVINVLPAQDRALVRNYVLTPRERRAIALTVAQGRFTDPVKALENVAAELGEDYETVSALIESLEKRHMLYKDIDPPRNVAAGEPFKGPTGVRYVKGPDA